MNRFRADNTEGYNEQELDELNAAWRQIASHGVVEDADDLAVQSMLDHWESELLVNYDAGKRGDALVAWFYEE
jgi:hypothetical protein